MKIIYRLILSNPLIRKYLNKRFGINPKEFELGFVREHGAWYADIKNWPKELKAQCLMIGEASYLLSYYAGSSDYIKFSITTEICDALFWLSKRKEDNHGATYICDNPNLNNVWLCNVTKFVFGKHPQDIYIKGIVDRGN